MTADPKLVAKQARERAERAESLVHYLRGLLGQAMRDEADAKKLAREAERAASG